MHIYEQFIISSLEIIILIFMSNAFLNIKFSNIKKFFPIFVVFSFASTLFSSILSPTEPYLLFLYVIYLPLFFILTFTFLYRLRLHDSFVLVILNSIFMVLSQFIAVLIMLVFPFQWRSFYYEFIGFLITLGIVVLVCNLFPLHSLYTFLKSANFPIQCALYNFFALCTIVAFATNLENSSPSQYLYSCIFGALIIAFINIELLVSYFHTQQERKQLQIYNDYLPIVEELVSQIRERQHDYNNTLQAIQMLPLSCKDHASLSAALLNYADYLMLEPKTYQLLKLNLNVLGGFLIDKCRQATDAGKLLDIEIKNFSLKTSVPEYVLIEWMGILIDNALEATPEKDTAYLSLDSEQNQIIIETKNIGVPLTEEMKNKMFTKGYTTKTENEKSHGIGLYKLQKQVASYKGKIVLYNTEENDTTYLCFQVIV